MVPLKIHSPRFAYLSDSLCLLACAAYAVNRYLVKPSVHSAFFQGSFNDLLLIPAALPPILWLHRRLRIRLHDAPPTPGEITLHLVVWSVVCEVAGPHFTARATGDVNDFLAYAAGAILAALWWHRDRLLARHEL